MMNWTREWNFIYDELDTRLLLKIENLCTLITVEKIRFKKISSHIFQDS